MICRIINVEVSETLIICISQKPDPIIVLLHISSGENHKLNSTGRLRRLLHWPENTASAFAQASGTSD